MFETPVNPCVLIPPFITHLTSIDDLAVAGAPPIEWVLPGFVEFAHGCVFVAHNARFDFAFLDANLQRRDYDLMPPPPVCTARLARRVVWPDVPNVRLTTFAQYFRTGARPTHRALPDAEACAKVLHGLLDLGGRLGILTLGDLHAAVRARGRPNFGKIRPAEHLPRRRCAYLKVGMADALPRSRWCASRRAKASSWAHSEPASRPGWPRRHWRTLPHPAMREVHARLDPIRAVRPGRDGPVPRALRRARDHRALRRA
ncbi:MAG: 3'-5' exonuclease, partial [Actinomycetota bacterium]